MAKLVWTVINNTQANLDVTQYVQSLSFAQGRPTAVSSYSGNSATITMYNFGGTENSVAINDKIYIKSSTAATGVLIIYIGYITSRTFDDNPGSGINSTMTISLNDAMLQAGIANFQNQSLTDVNEQIGEIGVLLPQIVIGTTDTAANMSTGSFTTNANQRINEIIAGDRGVLVNDFGIASYVSSQYLALIPALVATIGRTTSATQIAYQDITRIEAASNSIFYTQATVTGSASTVTKSSPALTTYGTRTFTATTAQSNLVSESAEWYANTFSEPDTLMLNLSLTDIAQNATALGKLNNLMSSTSFIEVNYTPPGGFETSGYFWPEQITVNATTSETRIDMSMTPFTYYANFILDDAIFGILDTDRLAV